MLLVCYAAMLLVMLHDLLYNEVENLIVGEGGWVDQLIRTIWTGMQAASKQSNLTVRRLLYSSVTSYDVPAISMTPWLHAFMIGLLTRVLLETTVARLTLSECQCI